MKLKSSTEANKMLICAHAMNSHCVVNSILSTVNAELDKWGGFQPKGWQDKETELNISAGGGYSDLRIYVTVNNPELYNQLLNSPLTGMDMECYSASYNKINVLVGYGIEAKISFTFQCPVPEEDIQVLHMLGKVKYDSGFSSPPSPYVSCEV